MRRPFVAGNWKLHHGPAATTALASTLRAGVPASIDATVAVFPTALSLQAAREALAGSAVAVGIQDVAHAPSGALTGANSAVMARELGCDFALVGHSERRSLFGESFDDTAAKLRAVLDAGMLPILCVGETLTERREGRAMEVVLSMVDAAIAGLEDDRLSGLSLAYEPVWAIGTGEVATPELAQAMHLGLRDHLRRTRPAWVADDLRILYGGSVQPKNASALLAMPDIDGALVGGASLDADSFLAIVRIATQG